MSTDTEATETICQLNLQCPEAAESLQVAVHEALMPATAARPMDEEYYYDSDDSVLDIDEQFPELAERVVQWQAAQRGATSMHHPGDHRTSVSGNGPPLASCPTYARCWIKPRQPGRPARSLCSWWLPMQLPFTSVRDLDHQRQLRP